MLKFNRVLFVVAACFGLAAIRRLSAAVLPAAASKPPMVFIQGQNIDVISGTGAGLITFSPILWGPGWGWTGLSGNYQAKGTGVQAVFHGNLSGSKAPFVLTIDVQPASPRQLRINLTMHTLKSTKLTKAVMSIAPGATLVGPGKATVVGASGKRAVKLPFGRGTVAKKLSQLDFRDKAGRIYRITATPATFTSSDSQARVELAHGFLKAGVVRHVSLLLTLPSPAKFYLKSAPLPAHWKTWFVWNAAPRPGKGPCVFSMRPWLASPAGKYGWITRQGEKLMYHGHAIKLWGVDSAYIWGCAPPLKLGAQRSRFYARYGINVVRLHKFADGQMGICAPNSFTHFTPQGLHRVDGFIHQLALHGIYSELSANFGSVQIGPADAKGIPYANQWPANGQGWRNTGGGSVWFSRPLQNLQIAQEINFLNHHDSFTHQRNADDPAIFCVELINENDAFWYTAMGAMQGAPAIKKLAGQEFFAWLKQHYANKAALLKAWGPKSLNAFAGEGFGGESWSGGMIYPAGNPWFYDPGVLKTNQLHNRARLLDTMHFIYHLQNAFYQRYVKALRRIGYKGLIVTSNWQAGSGYSNYLNLSTDARCGSIIDRHNYFSGTGSMLASPGDGILSSGMQQVANRPFMLSEWISVFPNPFGVEGPSIVGAYGMGLNGWDASEMFQANNAAGFSESLGQNPWDVMVPQVLGVFPAVSREILRGDVREAHTVFARNVCVPDLFKGKLGFQDTVKQGYDVKSLNSSKVPAASLAVGRGVVRFTKTFKPTPTAHLSKYMHNGMLRSTTGQLAWHPGATRQSGFITINTAATQAVVGFAGGRKIALKNITIAPRTNFAAIYVTALGRHGTIGKGRRVLVTTLARAFNTGMRMIKGRMVAQGHAPTRVEPVNVDITLRRAGTPVVYVLNAAGQRTGKTVPVVAGHLRLNGARTHAVYYEIVYP